MMTQVEIGAAIKAGIGNVSISEAARRLKVARPGLSNLIAGKTRLTKAMATKLAWEFPLDGEALMHDQGRVDAEMVRQSGEAASSADAESVWKRNAADYHDITSTDIARWAETNRARAVLPVLVRRLVYSIAPDSKLVDFPGHDAGQRPGWDGRVEALRSSPWVPEGVSGWELSVSSDLQGKPTADIEERRKLSAAERRSTTFIFVTARHWPGKTAWEEKQRAVGDWFDVRVYDAVDLAQWLDQSAATQAWFAHELNRSVDGVRSMDEVARSWSDATQPALSAKLFEPAVEAHRTRLHEWLGSHGERPFIVVADSAEEATAFLSEALKETDGSIGVAASAACAVSSPDALRRLAAAAPNAILITENASTELAASSLYRSHRIITARARTTIEQDPDIALEPLSDEAIDAALEDMGIARDDWPRWRAEAGNSPTILRRRLALSPELRRPAWAHRADLLRKLMPIFLAGAWKRDTAGDMNCVELLADKKYQAVERDVAELAALADAPVWAIGNYRGLVSRKDALFAIADAITPEDFDSFLKLAELVFSLDDPQFDLPVEERWRANILGKRPEVSGALRQSVGELLVLFALYGDRLVGGRLGSIAARIEGLVGKVLKGVDARTWLSRQGDLQLLAEAAPDAFLSAVEADLKSANPQILAMLRPVGSALFDGPDRTGLLWALELAAWQRDHFGRVFDILGRLSEVAIDDNWMNKPENSLYSLVRFWWPQTAAPLDDRLRKMEAFARTGSNAAWKLLMAQLNNHGFASANAHPRWRNDAVGGDARPLHADQFATRRKALDLLVAWPKYSMDQLGQMFEQFSELPDEDRSALIDRGEAWLAADASDLDRSELAERLRRYTVRHKRRGRDGSDTDRVAAFAVKLVPEDLLMRHRWLFADYYIPESRSEIEDEKFDFEARDKRISKARELAVGELYGQRGLEGVVALLKTGKAHGAVGQAVGQVIEPGKESEIVTGLLAWSESEMVPAIDSCLFSLIHRADADVRDGLLSDASRSDGDALRLFLAAPFERSTWELIERERPSISGDYWKKVALQPWHLEASDLSYMIDRALGADRPLATFQAVGGIAKKADATDLTRVLRAIPTAQVDEAEAVRVDAWHIGEALVAVAIDDVMPLAERAQLEFHFLDGLRHDQHGIPALEMLIANDPNEFVHLVKLLFKRDDGSLDPVDDDASPEQRQTFLTKIWNLLDQLARIPGTREDGSIDPTALLTWIVTARDGCAAAGRQDSCDRRIGTLLAKSPDGKDGYWPHPAVRDALDAIGTEAVKSGFHTGKFNNRGVVYRAPGGGQERDLAKKFRGDAEAIRLDHPFSARCLMELAADYQHQGQWHDTDEAVRKRLGRP
jgi:plasmid maintenance system antidote protein VapI